MRVVAFCLVLLAPPAAADPFPVARCINLGAALEAPSEGDWGYRIRQSDVARIAAAGFDTVRLPVRFDAHWTGTRIAPAFQARVDEVIGWADAAGLNTILVLHHFWPLYDDPSPANVAQLHAIWDALADH